MPIHITLTTQSASDPSAWVSAGAAVVQAIGAIAAIFYSIKLAREAAAREKAADEAAARRIEEAAIAAEQQRDLDDMAAERRVRAEANARYNAPIKLAMDMAERVIAELEAQRDRQAKATAAGATDYRYLEAKEAQLLLVERLPALVQEADHVEVATTMRRLLSACSPFLQVGFPPAELVRGLTTKIAAVREAEEALMLLQRD